MDTADNRLTRRHALKITGFAITVAVPGVLIGPAWAAGVPLRKNIDDLSADELDAYKHSVKILMDRSVADQTVQQGYLWQAALHNDFDRVRPDGEPGGCEHRSERFFPWHRAHLAGFEKLLRETDPPKTANVTIPYWDWTKPASGTRFPTAFEDPASPLFHAARYKTAADVPSFPPGLLPILIWDADLVKTEMVQERDWFLFAGYPVGTEDEGPGTLEIGPHNTFHPSIGPTMGAPSTASLDPIYWSFHAYIDLVWARWQRVHVDATHPQIFATPNTQIWVEPFIPIVKEMASTEALPAGSEYSYDYDFSSDGQPMLVASAEGNVTPIAVARSTDRLATSVPMRSESDKRKLLKLRNVAVIRDVSYTLSVYVHPVAIDVEALQPSEREQYLADTATMWMSGGHAHNPSTLHFDLTKAIAAYGDGEFSVSIIAAPLPPPTEPVPSAAAVAANDDKFGAAGPLWGALELEER